MYAEGISARAASSARLHFRWTLWLLLGLITVDALFIELHRLYLQQVVDARFALTSERSYPEFYEHLKELLLVIFAGVLAVRTRERLYACWAGVFTYLLLDDTFEFHEHAGAMIAARLPTLSVFGVSSESAGELVPTALVVLAIVIAMLATWRSGSALARRFSVRVFVALLALGTFGVLIDLIHSMVRRDPWRYRLGILEEGGEMVAITVLVLVVATSLQAARKRST